MISTPDVGASTLTTILRLGKFPACQRGIDLIRSSALMAALLLVLAVSVRPSWGADNVWSVERLNDSKPWDKFVDSPLAIHVEGRIGSFGSGQLRLLRCDAKFTIDNTKLRSIAPKSTVELKGRFKKEGGRIEFAVDDLKVVPGYAEQFEARTLKLKRATAEEWTELGDWVARLSHFYEDADLLKKATGAYAKAIEVEYESLKPADADSRFLLAKKVDDFKLPQRRRMELIHEGLRIQWQALQKAEPPEPNSWEGFAKGLADHLSGTTEPLSKLPRDLKETYEQDPVATYRKASEDVRVQLHRLFYVAVIRKRLMQGASPDGRDGDQIADQIEERIPEEAALAEKQRVLSLGYRMANVASATRADVESLALALRDRGQNESAKQTLLQWIKSHESRLKGDGAVGLLQLADEYLLLQGNETVAVEYLSDAYRMDPAFEDVKLKLNSLGYQWKNSRWTKSDPGKPDVSPSNPQSPTRIDLGMSATDLRRLLGQPGSLSRAITSRGITEIWSFGPAGGSRLVVRLEQKGRDTDAKVTFVSNPK